MRTARRSTTTVAKKTTDASVSHEGRRGRIPALLSHKYKIMRGEKKDALM